MDCQLYIVSKFSYLCMFILVLSKSALTVETRPGSRYEMKGGPSDIPGGPGL